MSHTVCTINKGVSRPLEFRGIKGQYAGALGVGVVGLLFLFALLHVAGVSSYACIAIVLPLAGWLYRRVYRLSKKYGQHGLMKHRAAKRLPKIVRSGTRTIFYNIEIVRHE
jgi:hypothetical protein